MRHLRVPAFAAAVAVVVATLAVARPVAADALYPSAGGGTWGWDAGCDDTAWSSTFELWYILNDAQDYGFDIPNPDLAPGESVQVDLEPTVVGTLNGSVTLSGADTISDVIPASNPHPGDTMWQDRIGAPADFTLVFTPGTPTTGDLPVPDEFAANTGFAAVRATITIDGGAQQTIVMLAAGFTACGADPGGGSPLPNTRTSDGSGPGSVPAAFFLTALGTALLTLRLVNAKAIRRRR